MHCEVSQSLICSPQTRKSCTWHPSSIIIGRDQLVFSGGESEVTFADQENNVVCSRVSLNSETSGFFSYLIAKAQRSAWIIFY